MIDYAIVEKNQTRTLVGWLGAQASDGTANKYSNGRDVTISSTGATFSNSYRRQWNTTSANAGTVTNVGSIPLEIWGI